MIYDEESILMNVLKNSIYTNINKYNIIVLLDDTTEYDTYINQYIIDILIIFDNFFLFTINTDYPIYLEREDIFLIKDIKTNNNKYPNFYLKFKEIIEFNNILNLNSLCIIIMYIYNISIDNSGLNNIVKFYKLINNVIDDYYIYIILLNDDIENIYKFFFVHDNITIITYKDLCNNDDFLLLFDNII